MTHISGRISIAASPERVFDAVADSRNEPLYNPAMREVRLMTAPPIGRGSRFSAQMSDGRTVMLVELTRFERPRLLGSSTSSALMDTAGTLTFTPDGSGTTMAWDWQVRPKRWLRLLGPLFGVIGSTMERKIWRGLKAWLEG